MEEQQDIQKLRNSALSIVLITVNIVLAIIFFGSKISDPDHIGSMMIASMSATTLIGLYAFAYKGKKYRAGKWIFALSLLVSLCLVGLLWYGYQLGKAFQH